MMRNSKDVASTPEGVILIQQKFIFLKSVPLTPEIRSNNVMTKGIFNGLDYYWKRPRLSVHDNVKTFWYIFSFAYNYNGILKRGRNHNEIKKDNHQWLQTQFNSIYPIELSSEFKKWTSRKALQKFEKEKKKKMYSHLRLSDGFI